MGEAKRVLVTGATGFVGRQVLGPLLERGYTVHVALRRQHEGLDTRLILHTVDLLDCSTHRALIAVVRPTHLLHIAWYAEHGKFWDAVENVAWLKASLSLAEAFCVAGGERMLGVGSCAEYEWAEDICIEGQTRECPTSLYGATKLAAGQCFGALAQAHSTSAAWARLFFPYGPGEPEARLIPYVIRSLLQGETARCTHGRQLRDYLHVADIGDALAAILDSEVIGPINVGSGIPMQIGDIVQRIGSLIGRPELIQLGAIPEPAHSGQVVVASNKKLSGEVLWTPHYALDEGLQDTIAWWRNAVRRDCK